MRGKYFIDTNIIVYSFQKGNKSEKASVLIKEALSSQKGIISFQVIQEFMNVALKKFKTPLKTEDCRDYLQNILTPLCEVYPTLALYEKTLDIINRYKFSFYDSLIIAASLSANCQILLSEDLTHQQEIENITIINPFV